MTDEDDLIYECDIDGESLAKHLLDGSVFPIFVINDETNEIYFADTIDKSAKYHMRVTGYYMCNWHYPKLTYHLREIK